MTEPVHRDASQERQPHDARLAELESALADRDRTIAALRRNLAAVEAKLSEVVGSRSWRLAQRLQALRARWLPRGSARARIAGTVVRAAGRAVARSSWLARRVLSRARRITRGAAGPGFETPPWADTVARPSPVARHEVPVDIVICVHDALDDVKACLESLIRTTTPPYRVILIDDGSAAATRDYLAAVAADQGFTLIRNRNARGYTRAANQGLRHATGEFVVLLNSDTVLTPRWLDLMVACADSDPRVGLVGPLANTASWQSVPAVVEDDGDWAANDLPTGQTIAGMADLVGRASPGVYPSIPFLNGFCLLIRRRVLDRIGPFDEDAFGDGYGEENDFCERARRAGFLTAVAGDAYVWHSQSRSYSHVERHRLVEASNATLLRRYGAAAVSAGVGACRTDRVLEGVRARVRVAGTRNGLIERGRRRWEGRRVLFLLPVAEPGGGAHVVVQEAHAMLRMGVDVRLLNLCELRDRFETWLPDIEVPVIYSDGAAAAGALVSGFDAVVATVFTSLEWMTRGPGGSTPVLGYYIQDFEPAWFSADTPGYDLALGSYARLAHLVRFTKTEWNRAIVRERVGVDSAVVGPSVDIDLFRPRGGKHGRAPAGPTRIAAMVRPSTPRRQPAETMQVLRELTARHGREVEVIVFGCEPDDPAFRELAGDWRCRHAGVLTRRQLAALFGRVDIFADFSAYQAMGLTALEAMASGAAVIVPRAGGADSFARHRQNAWLVDSGSQADCLAALETLTADAELRDALRRRALDDACDFAPEQSAFRILASLFPGERES